MANEKRSSVLVDCTVQRAVIFRVFGQWIAFAATSLIFLYFLQLFSDIRQQSVGDVLDSMWANYWPLTVASTLLLPIFVYDTIKFSHRFAGPMIAFRRALHDLADGKEMASLSFGDEDFWPEMADDLNAIARKLDEHSDSSCEQPEDEMSCV